MASCSKEPGVSPDIDNPVPNTLPVVFHVLYENSGDRTQYIPQDRIKSMVELLNKFYSATLFAVNVSVPVEVAFALADTDPSGQRMLEPGIHRVRFTGAASVDPDAFLYSKPIVAPYSDVFWNPKRYINIWLCRFDLNNQYVTGVSFLPYSMNSNPLDSLPGGGEYYLNRIPTGYMHGIILNNMYWTDAELSDGALTMCHEMGHYLGLKHAFDETGYGRQNHDDYADDACRDTPQYDRQAYEVWLNRFLQSSWAAAYADSVFYRNSYSGQRFRSTNVMDYYFGDRTTLTADQRERIRYVLKYSPLIPREAGGSRTDAVRSSVMEVSEAPAPVMIKCPRR